MSRQDVEDLLFFGVLGVIVGGRLGYVLFYKPGYYLDNPLEAGLGWVTKLDKGDFVGAAALRKQKEQGVPRELIGLKLVERGVPREGYPVAAAGKVIGKVTSGTQSPTLNAGIATGVTLYEVARRRRKR